MISLHRRAGTWNKRVDRFISLTDFGKSRFVAAGLPSEKIVIKPNFVDDLPERTPPHNRIGFLFVGRISAEKGIHTLIEAAKLAFSKDQGDLLRVVGDGPLSEIVSNSPFKWLGSMPSHEVRELMNTASALIIPSTWYEGFPIVLVEALASGLPIIASRIGALTELVEDGVTGLHFNPGDSDDLANKIRWAIAHPEEIEQMGRRARDRYEALYTPTRNYNELLGVYQGAIDDYSRSTGNSSNA